LKKNPNILADKLDFPRAHRKTREEVAHWVLDHPELRVNIEQNIHHKSAGYKARGRNILEKIKNI
jgi:hypothetical protein